MDLTPVFLTHHNILLLAHHCRRFLNLLFSSYLPVVPKRSANLFKFLNWDNLAMRRDRRLYLLMFDIIHKNFFQGAVKVNSTNLALEEITYTLKYHVPKTKCHKGLISYKGHKFGTPCLINDQKLKSAKSKSILKKTYRWLSNRHLILKFILYYCLF